MSERKLASIRMIDSIRPIEGADAIEVATVGGWDVVVKKGEFIEGDLAVYFEIDSWIPTELAPFLSKGAIPREYMGIKGERLRTIKLRGQLSQGLLLPVKEFDGMNFILPAGEDIAHAGNMHGVSEGDDVTEFLGIVKYNPPMNAQLAGVAKGNFPSFIRKTDQERAQNLTRQIKDSLDKEDEYEVTMKLDGSSMTAFYNDGEVGVCSRNLQLKIDDENKGNSFVRAMFDSGLDTALVGMRRNIAVQGELMGPGIQGNRENLSENKLFVFDVFDIDTQKYLTPIERKEFMDMLTLYGVNPNKVDHVPVLGVQKLPTGDVKELLLVADGPSIVNKVREGLVWKRVDGKFSFKTISNKYLLSSGS